MSYVGPNVICIFLFDPIFSYFVSENQIKSKIKSSCSTQYVFILWFKTPLSICQLENSNCSPGDMNKRGVIVLSNL